MPATVWKGYISFGLVSFPVRLFSAARAESVHFHMLHRKDLSRVKEVWYCAEENKPIDRSDIVKGYETSKGEYVIVEDDELKSIAPATAGTMDIVQFVREGEVDSVGHLLNVKQVGRGAGGHGLRPCGAAEGQVQNRSPGNRSESDALQKGTARDSVLAHLEILPWFGQWQ